MLSTYGNYPNRVQKARVATLLEDMLELPSSVFYDPLSHQGFLERGLENSRRKLIREYFH